MRVFDIKFAILLKGQKELGFPIATGGYFGMLWKKACCESQNRLEEGISNCDEGVGLWMYG
jgi:hypothetical protein